MSIESLRLLAVTDSAPFLETIDRARLDLGPCVLTVTGSGAECLLALKKSAQPYEVILLDAALRQYDEAPKCNGNGLVTKVKELCPAAELVLFNSSSIESTLDAIRQGAFYCLPNVVSVEELKVVLQRAVEHNLLRKESREKQMLERLMEIGTALLGCKDQGEVFDCGLRAVANLGFERARLYFWVEEERVFILKGHFGPEGAPVGRRWITTESETPELWREFQPVVYRDGDREGRSISEPLGEVACDEYVCVPLKMRNGMRGLIAADNRPSGNAIRQEQVNALVLIALQVAAAIENRCLHEDTQKRAEQLEALRQTALGITAAQDGKTLLCTIIKHAVELLGAKNGGIYKYYETHQELKVVADYRRPDHLGRTLKVGEGMAGRLVQTGKAYKIIDNYRQWNGQATTFKKKCPYEAVLEVLLKWQEQIIGVIYVDDEVGRKFTPADARLLELFADQAAIALVNAELLTKDEATLRRMKKFSMAIKDIMGNLGTTSLNERLNLIAKRTAGLLEAEACGVFLVRREGFLRLEASFGHRDGGFEKGKELLIQSGPKSGLTGHIAHEGKLFIAHGDDLNNHFAVSGKAQVHLRSGRCDSIVALPLKKKVGEQHKLIGLLRVDNKRDIAGRALPTLQFTPTDKWMLHIFAKAVVVALEGAELVERLERLVESSPNGVIATNPSGHITLCNERGGEILGYAVEELIGKPVTILYNDPAEARRVGKLLHQSEDGKLTDHMIEAKSKTQEVIPIRQTAAWLYDSRGALTGSVGYFEDLRAALETEKSLDLLLKASKLVVEAKDYTAGLQRLAQMVSSLLPHTFCRILLLDETASRLTVEAACATLDANGEQNSMSGLYEPLDLTAWPGLYRQLVAGSPRVLLSETNPDQLILKKLSALLKLDTMIQALLMVPLKLDDKVIGLLEFGELHGQNPRPFTASQIDFASAIAANTASLIDRMRRFDTMARREELIKDLHNKLMTLYRISQFIQSASLSNPAQILNAVLTAVTAEFGLRFNRACILFFDQAEGNLIGRMAIGNFSENAAVNDWTQINESGRTKLEDYLNWVKQDPLPLTPVGKKLMKLRFKLSDAPDDVFVRCMRDRLAIQLNEEELVCLPEDFVGAFEPALPLVIVPIEARERVLGFLVADNKFTRTAITEDDLNFLSTLANNAATALENIELLDKTHADLVVKERLHMAALKMAGALNPDNVEQSFVELELHTIAREAIDMFGAIACTIWPQEKGKFMPKELVGLGIPEEDLHHFREIEPTPEGTTQTVLKEGWVCVADVADTVNTKQPFLKDAMRARLLNSGVRSFQGITLKVGTEPVGVLYVSYGQPRTYSVEDRRALEEFATYAALFINIARLLDLIKTINSLAKVVAEVTALGERDKNLPLIADKTWEAIGCGSLVLYAYDRIKNKWKYPPSHPGVDFPEEAWPSDEVPPTSIVYTMLKQEEPYVAERVSIDPLLKNRRFVIREGIKSCAAFPLRAEGQEVGVMFINYREPHRFTPEELSNIALFAHQTAVAIHNAQLYEEKLNEQKALLSLSQTLLDTLDIKQTLNGAVNVAMEVLPADLCDIVLADERGNLNISAAASKTGMAGENYLMSAGAAEHAAYIMSQPDMVYVENYAEERRFEVQPVVAASGITSGMGVRIGRGGNVVGAMRIHNLRTRPFTKAEANLLSLIAYQTAIAIGSTEHHTALLAAKEKLAQQSTMEWMGVAGSAWAHDVTIKALVFKENAEALLRLVNADEGSPRPADERRRLTEKLQLIKEQAQEVLDMPITTPLSIRRVPVNNFLRERIVKLCEQRMDGIEVNWSLTLSNEVVVKISPEWFSRAVLDVVVLNAFDAMASAERKALTVSTSLTDRQHVEIKIADSGRGIPEKLRGQLFTGPITDSKKGKGIGLFLAAKVIQTFGGHIRLLETASAGATFIISVPAATDTGD